MTHTCVNVCVCVCAPWGPHGSTNTGSLGLCLPRLGFFTRENAHAGSWLGLRAESNDPSPSRQSPCHDAAGVGPPDKDNTITAGREETC